jgi:hypothetical protein
MAKLFVSAVGEDTIAAPGNAQRTYVIVSVEDAAGNPVTGMAAANFQLGTEIVGPGGSTSSIQSVSNGKLPGIYLLSVIPLAGQTWKSGVYIFSVAVTHGADKGQALCSFLMD